MCLEVLLQYVFAAFISVVFSVTAYSFHILYG